MSESKRWQFELDEYIRQAEPNRAERSEAWQTAIGLQAVDGLQTSEYLLETAKEHIEGKIDINVAQRRIQNYYEERNDRKDEEPDTKEADIVSSRIAALLGEKTFQFSPAEWQEIHRRLFERIFEHAGEIRTYNITKKEWVLKGETVLYASHESIKSTLDYDFNAEKNFVYRGLSVGEIIKHIAIFTSGIWQIHPFCEGNTRATAVFVIKYLKTLGFSVSNDAFAENSWYFRNALVRANYSNLQEGIHATTRYLELFFQNLLIKEKHQLKNRYLHVDYVELDQNIAFQSAKTDISKCKNCTLEELEILKIIVQDPTITQKEIAKRTGKSERTIKNRTVTLQEKGYIQRINGKRNGRWEVLVEVVY